MTNRINATPVWQDIRAESSHSSIQTETRIFVVKVASRCNLACSYCYMYFQADQSWRNQPTFMSRTTVSMFARRLEEHARTVNGKSILVVLHGGEPLLYPQLDEFLGQIRKTVQSSEIVFSVQTNGTLINTKNLEILARHGVRIGISVDGNRESHDRRRVTHSGSRSYDSVIEGLALAKRTVPHLLDSVLQVIDTSIDPVEMLDILEGYGVSRADLLFPDLNHDTIRKSSLKPGDIGEWLIKVFDNWVRRERAIYIRLFITLIRLLCGGRTGTEQFGAYSGGALMIETDGSYEIHDGLKTAFHGAGHTGMTVMDTPVSVVESLPLAKAFREKASGASLECLKCRLFPVCGGGSPLHRYSKERDFDQPSVYCKDLTRLIEHLETYLRSVRPKRVLAVGPF